MLPVLELYQDELKPKMPKFGFKQVLSGVLFINVLGVALFLGVFIYAHQQGLDLQKLEKEDAEIQQRITQLGQELKLKNDDTSMKLRLEDLQRKLSKKQQLKRFLLARGPKEQYSFDVYLSALARKSTAGVWLDKMIIDNDDDFLYLSGTAKNVTLVSAFLENLSEELAFSNKDFENFEIKKNLKNSRYIDFKISSKPLAEDYQK